MNKKILHRPPGITYRRWGWNALVFLLVYVFGKTVVISPASYWKLILAAIPVSLSVIILYAFAFVVFERDAFKWLVSSIKSKIPVHDGGKQTGGN